jgi:hypothetical protein
MGEMLGLSTHVGSTECRSALVIGPVASRKRARPLVVSSCGSCNSLSRKGCVWNLGFLG